MISEKRISQYIRIALSTISADRESKEKIRREMNYDIQNKVFDSGKGDPFEVLGNPASYAREFLEERKSTYTQVRTRFSRTCGIGGHAGYEFISKATVLGLPFIHINTRPFGVAKGIIAVVNVAIGVLAIGGVSIGLLSLGGVALSLLLSLGGASASLFSAFGGLAIALYLAGGALRFPLILQWGSSYCKKLCDRRLFICKSGYRRRCKRCGCNIRAEWSWELPSQIAKNGRPDN